MFKEEWMVQENQRRQVVKKTMWKHEKATVLFCYEGQRNSVKIEMFSYVKIWMQKSRRQQQVSRWRNIQWSVRNETDQKGLTETKTLKSIKKENCPLKYEPDKSEEKVCWKSPLPSREKNNQISDKIPHN